jgi:hypothetical protein
MMQESSLVSNTRMTSLDMPSEESVYQALVARQLQWDNLVWQVPVLSFTAQAFLFTIALGPDTSGFGRIVSAAMSIVITILSITLLKSHRISEITDAHWLKEMERKDSTLPKLYRIHGPVLRKRRLRHTSEAGKLDSWVPRLKGYVTWIFGLALFGVGALVVIVVTIFWPSLLDSSSKL